MFDLGWTELLVIGIVALIVIGPEDLPRMFQAVGRFMGKARGMAREFSKAMNEAADQSGVRDITKSLESAANPVKATADKVREATAFKPGGATETLSKERQEAKEKILAAGAKAAEDRMAREKAAAAAAAAVTAEDPGMVAAPAPEAPKPAPTPEPAADSSPETKA